MQSKIGRSFFSATPPTSCSLKSDWKKMTQSYIWLPIDSLGWETVPDMTTYPLSRCLCGEGCSSQNQDQIWPHQVQDKKYWKSSCLMQTNNWKSYLNLWEIKKHSNNHKLVSSQSNVNWCFFLLTFSVQKKLCGRVFPPFPSFDTPERMWRPGTLRRKIYLNIWKLSAREREVEIIWDRERNLESES